MGKRGRKRKRSGWAALLFGDGSTDAPKPTKMSKAQRRRLAREKKEAEHREGFLEYMEWLTRQPKETA
jgi:hypothetical protein